MLEAARFIDPDHLGTTDDCGFSPFGDDASTSRDTAFAKIRARIVGTDMAVGRARRLKRRTRASAPGVVQSERAAAGPPPRRRAGGVRARGVHDRGVRRRRTTAPLRRSTRRGSSRSPAPSTTATPATSSTSSAVASPPSTVTTTGAATCSSPAAASRLRSTTTTASRVATCGSRNCRSPVTDLTAVTGAYPLDIDGDGHSELVVLRVGEDVVLRGLGDCRFERANESLGIDGGDTWTAAFSATWEGDNALPTLAFGDYLDADREHCEDSRLLRPDAGGSGYAAPIALSPGYCTLSMLFSDWSRSGQRDLRMSNDRHYYRDGSEQLWKVEPRCDAEAVHRGGRVAATADLGNGDRQRGHHRGRLPGGVPDEPGRQQAADARRRARPPDLRGHRPRARRHRHTGPTPAATSCRPPPGTPSSPTSTTTRFPTCSSPRATSRRKRDTPRVIRATC